MIKLYLLNSKEERTFIAETADEQSAFKKMYDWLKEKNIETYYTRMWSINTEKEKGWEIDYGSYSQFFIIINEEVNENGSI